MVSTSSKKGVQLLVSHFKKLNVKHIVFSPGSRNAPLVIGFHQDSFFETVVIPDERSAAFFALGMAQQLSEPVAIICTSGSAILNYYPAVAEAFYQNIPLMVISADRPKAWIDQGDGQTIRQDEVLKNHILYSTELRENHVTKEDAWYNSREISAAYSYCNGIVKGPVHINFPFSEPLYEQTEMEVELMEMNPIRIAKTTSMISSEDEVELKSIWKTAEKVMILVGQHAPDDRLKATLKALNSLPNVAVMVENTANMIDRDFIHCIDRTLDGIPEEKHADFAPDLLITIGGAIVSKKIKKYFRTHTPKNYWRINQNFPLMDTYQAMTRSIPMVAASFLEQLESYPTEANSNYGAQWKQVDFLQQAKAEDYIHSLTTYSDLKVYDLILDCIPDGSILHLGNSSVIRYSQLFNPVFTIQYYSNRGTSGIDGSMSTAAGASWIKKNQANVLIIGDLSFFYDSNALWNTLNIPNLRIFVVNNGGGDIFNIISGPSSTGELVDCFVAPHHFSAKGICESYHVAYFKAASLDEIESQMGEFFQQDDQGIKLMEIFTDNSVNSKELHQFLKI